MDDEEAGETARVHSENSPRSHHQREDSADGSGSVSREQSFEAPAESASGNNGMASGYGSTASDGGSGAGAGAGAGAAFLSPPRRTRAGSMNESSPLTISGGGAGGAAPGSPGLSPSPSFAAGTPDPDASALLSAARASVPLGKAKGRSSKTSSRR
jgi:hypothetical protein